MATKKTNNSSDNALKKVVVNNKSKPAEINENLANTNKSENKINDKVKNETNKAGSKTTATKSAVKSAGAKKQVKDGGVINKTQSLKKSDTSKKEVQSQSVQQDDLMAFVLKQDQLNKQNKQVTIKERKALLKEELQRLKDLEKSESDSFEQLIMDGIEPPKYEEILESSDSDSEKVFDTTSKKRRRKVKEARILTKEEMGYREKPVKQKKKKYKIDEVRRFNVNKSHGLSKEQVAKREVQGFTNKIENKNVKTYRSIFLGNIFTFFNFLTFLVAGALIWVKSYQNLFFVVIILVNIAIGIIQEIKAKKTIQKISLVAEPLARVVREGHQVEISVDEVVLDDIIMFALGNQICADSIVLEGEVEVNESLLTGESIAIKKKKGDTLLSGSFVVSGKCVAQVNRVGNYNYSAQLAAKAKEYSKPKSELLYSLRLIIKLIGVIIIPLSILMYNNNFEQLGTLPETIKQTAGSVIGMIPSGMFLLTSLALAVGVIKLARKRTLVQDLYSIEMLARIDVLCLDKTGTLTDGTMKVNDVIKFDNSNDNINEVMGSMLTALDDNNQTSRAMATYFGYSKEIIAKTIMPFSSSRKFSAVTFKNGQTFAIGAPEFVYKTKNLVIDKMVKDYAGKGFRVLLLVECEKEIDGEKLLGERKPVAMIVIEDHIREDAEQTIRWFKDNGVQVKIISGDNPITVSEVSKRVGVSNADRYISLEGLSEQQVIESATKYTVFGRVSPEQKLILVKALKNKGHKVAMTGDGVNDILALKEADCSIAMASGSEAARHVSNLVLLDSNFSSMPSVVAEGRRVVNNIQKSSSLFLMKTLFTIMISVLCLIIKIEYPFQPNQIMLLEFAVIGIPSFALALQPNISQIKGRFMANLMTKSVPAALILALNVVVIYGFEVVVGLQGQFVTMASLAITFTGLLVLLRISRPLDIFRSVLFTLMLLLVVFTLTFVPFDFFDYVSLSLQNILLIIIIVQASSQIYNSFVKVADKIQNFNEQKRKDI